MSRFWRPSQRRVLRRALRIAQSNRCALCGQPFADGRPTLEHVNPRSNGGRHRGNLVLTHLRCNAERADSLPSACLLIMLEAVNARLAL